MLSKIRLESVHGEQWLRNDYSYWETQGYKSDSVSCFFKRLDLTYFITAWSPISFKHAFQDSVLCVCSKHANTSHNIGSHLLYKDSNTKLVTSQ